MSHKEKVVFNAVVENFQIEIFSNPKKEGPVSARQRDAIIALIDRMQYAKKSDLNLRAHEAYKTELGEYTHNFDLFQESFNQIISEYYNRSRLFQSSDIQATQIVYHQLEELAKNGTKETDFNEYIKYLNNQVLDATSKDQLTDKMKTLQFLV